MSSGLVVPGRRSPAPGLRYILSMALLALLLLVLAETGLVPPPVPALIVLPLGPH